MAKQPQQPQSQRQGPRVIHELQGEWCLSDHDKAELDRLMKAHAEHRDRVSAQKSQHKKTSG